MISRKIIPVYSESQAKHSLHVGYSERKLTNEFTLHSQELPRTSESRNAEFLSIILFHYLQFFFKILTSMFNYRTR
jgi:hypothetical protein